MKTKVGDIIAQSIKMFLDSAQYQTNALHYVGRSN